jgi:hypothetical protein
MSVQTFRKNCDGGIHAAAKKEYMAKNQLPLDKTANLFIFNVPGLKPPPLGGQLLAVEKAGRLR